MFWSDWGQNPRIEHSGLDGSGRITLVTKDLFWPNALTIDYPTKRLYFADARMDFIEFCSYDGTGRYKVFGNDHVSEEWGCVCACVCVCMCVCVCVCVVCVCVCKRERGRVGFFPLLFVSLYSSFIPLIQITVLTTLLESATRDSVWESPLAGQ